MLEQEILDGNKLIAEFMNVKIEENKKGRKSIILNGLKFNIRILNYHSSWDWLMPCIGKISNKCEDPEELDGLEHALLCNDITTAWRLVVDYLTNFNIKN